MSTRQTLAYQAMPEPEHDLRNENLARLVVAQARGRTLLDVGCGYGVHLHRALEAGFDAVGIEPESALVALAKERFGDCEIVQERIESFGTERCFDNVLMVDVLEMMEDDDVALERGVELLAPGGRLILCVPAFQALYGSRDESMGFHRRYDRRPTLERLRWLGLEVESTRYWNAIATLPYWLVYRILRLHREADGLRGGAPEGAAGRLAASLLGAWYRRVEHRWNPGFGLSLLVCARRPE